MKKYRGIRRHYRNIDRKIKELQLHFEPDSWYNLWHIHLDWTGISNKGLGHCRSHFKKYIELLEKVEVEAKASKIDYQCWIFVDSKDGTDDALYIQSENPHSEFPLVLSNIEWGIEVPEQFKGIINMDKYVIGRTYDEKETLHCYFIYKNGTAIPFS